MFEPVQKRYNHVVSEPKVESREVAVYYRRVNDSDPFRDLRAVWPQPVPLGR